MHLFYGWDGSCHFILRNRNVTFLVRNTLACFIKHHILHCNTRYANSISIRQRDEIIQHMVELA